MNFNVSMDILGMPVTASATVFPAGTSRVLSPDGTDGTVCQTGSGILAAIYGGELPHIGAVTVISPEGILSTTEFPSHKDSTISEKWARSLCASGFCPVVVTAGIHYDCLPREKISEIIEKTDVLLLKMKEQLSM